ncbi:biotin/lipoyl-containing protein [Desulfotalea psychrophila]|uniref:Probable pyruvate carboxylase, beta chain n=1 Tax=Desulfotalea psychrophila (strain LSv54 / DSM 12343) TaxID=177439 RepID=Q6AQF8_DESPS|nr:biotin/lipoyl-containing protein [Desulfotalea psychrophila]CAG35415.1 probable pyruvate carboxylase, beta chain [Desulfotalea psychrophila LSv54]
MGKKVIKFMDTSFRDGFQSVFGARVLTDDFMPAVKASVDAGITHIEAGGGARFQSLFFYCGESAFDMMDRFRAEVGPDVELQTLARGINVVALSQCPRDIIDLHAKMFKKHGMTTIRNFDALNDVHNLEYSGARIAHHGLKHQIVVSMMDLPPGCEGAHTAEFYMDRLKQIIAADIPFDSICFKDASGTSNPRKVYNTFKMARAIVPEGTILWFHTHDTAGLAIAQNMAAIEGGADGIDLAKSPVSGGTCQADILSQMHALKGTDYTLDLDYEKVLVASEAFELAMKDYFIPPEAKMVSPTVTLSPMPGGALTANTMMMRDTGTLHLYPQVIKEMSEVVRRGGFGTSVTPVSQFYFQQAYLNVTQGRWKKINPSYGNMVLGYFGNTPVPADPEIVALASKQLGKPVFTDDPLDILEPGIPKATKILEENNLPVSDENIFIIASCEQKGLDFLQGKAITSIRKITDEKPVAPKGKGKKAAPVAAPVGPRSYSITVNSRAYDVVVSEGGAVQASPATAAPAAAPVAVSGTEVEAPTPGNILKILVDVGDSVTENQPLLVMEAMKMESEVTAPCAGKVLAIEVATGDTVQAGTELLIIG